uniref:DUF4157 domain-containing protein n=1 Tax=viral metagenome TaxID=1070528 RepID=A0A6C0D765_9ZZZZ
MNYIKEAEIIDRFNASCKNSFLNNLARKNFAYVTDYNSYFSNIREFVKNYEIFNDINIVQLNHSAENGFPHTRPNNIICIPSDARFPSLEVTLFHEAVHIHQRNNKDAWDKFLAKEGWTEFSKREIPERWLEKIRYNPDTFLAPFYIFENRWVPLPMYKSDYNPVFSEINIMYYDTVTGVLEHEPPESFIKKYGNDVRQTEHPYEIYAVLLESKGPVNNNDIINYIK